MGDIAVCLRHAALHDREAFWTKRVPCARPDSTKRTRTPNWASSTAKDSVNAFTAALLAV